MFAFHACRNSVIGVSLRDVAEANCDGCVSVGLMKPNTAVRRARRHAFWIVLVCSSQIQGDAFTLRPLYGESFSELAAKKVRSSKGPRFSQAVHRGRKKSPMKETESIDSLEERLVQRWGTDLHRWTAQDLDDDDDMEQRTEMTTSFRGRPVKDPWQLHTEPLEKVDMVALKAKKNQERLRQTKTRRDSAPAHNKDSTENVDIQSSDAVEEPTSGTFFFREPVEPKTRQDSDQKMPERKERKPKPERIDPMSILDEDGDPIFLTLDQAEKSYREAAQTLETEQSDVVERWEDLGVTSPQLLSNLEAMSCEKPLSVQVKTGIPALEGRDVLVGTYTGSGKTLSFLVPIAERLLQSEEQNTSLRAIIVAPGRELASQIVSVARELLDGTSLSVMLAIGGTTFSRNLEQLRKRKPNIVVGTPGRLAELIIGSPGEKRGRLKISTIESLVLDEFDALLEYKPHREPTSAIIQRLKQQSGNSLQSILCSATASDMYGSPKLEAFLRLDYAVATTDESDASVTSASDVGSDGVRVSRTVIHGVIHLESSRDTFNALRSILHTEPYPQQILVFVENFRKVDIVIEKLAERGIIAAGLHGGAKSDKMDRAEVSRALREGYVGIVVATEMAARGLDAPLLTHVINLDLPTDSSHYAHRSGRCGRGGRPGVVINMTTSPKERKVPQKFASALGIKLHTVDVRNGKLNIVDEGSLLLDS